MAIRIATGSAIVDQLLQGGYEHGVITTIYGPAGAGKTCLCMLAAIEQIRAGKKVIYIDTEHGFSLERFQQLAEDYQELLPHLIFLRPKDFTEQQYAANRLAKIMNDQIGIIMVDTIAMLYRLELTRSGDVFEINRLLGKQINKLQEIAVEYKIPVLLSSQVYAGFNDMQEVKIVGGDLVTYQSKCVLEIKKLKALHRNIIIKKHRSLPEGAQQQFRISQQGFTPVEVPSPR